MHWSSPLSVLDLGLRWVSRLIVAQKGVDLLQELRNHPSAGEKQMAHSHGNEYQIRIIDEDTRFDGLHAEPTGLIRVPNCRSSSAET